MMDHDPYYIEETLPKDQGYKKIWEGENPHNAIAALHETPSPNRLELWTKSHATTEKGFAPLAFRPAGSTQVKISNSFCLLALEIPFPIPAQPPHA